ncbi:PLC-like phosphodiesterase [Haematococcus lacustris]
MGALMSFEQGGWDAHPGINRPYHPASIPLDDHDLPLSCYFVSSGHNSYLTGNQLNSTSGTSTITQCLQGGCRVIELDTYNRQPGFPGPVCRHGGTLTAPVCFTACVQAVRDSAFKASPYPVIITLENHADDANQCDMAQALRSILGELLFVPSPQDMQATHWLSPSQLQHKVLVRANVSKCHPELKQLVYIANTKFVSFSHGHSQECCTSSSFVESKVLKLCKRAYEGSGLPPPAYCSQASSSRDGQRDPGSSFPAASGAGAAGQEGGGDQPPPTALRPSLLRSWGSHGTKSGSFKGGSRASGKTVLSEDQEGEEEGEEEAVVVVDPTTTLEDLYRYNSRHLMRVYPKGLRVDSSNYDPSLAWSAGASLAALNWQSWDLGLWVNEAKFSLNAGSGYVLKPDWMLRPSGPNPLPPRRPARLSVLVHSAFAAQGFNLACFKDDLFVQVRVSGMPCDCHRLNSKVSHNSGRLLLDQRFDFQVQFPEMALLVVALKDEDMPGSSHDTLGYWSAPLASLATGTFKLTLKDLRQRQHSNRWIKVTLELASADKRSTPSDRSPAAPSQTTAVTDCVEISAVGQGSGAAAGVRAAAAQGAAPPRKVAAAQEAAAAGQWTGAAPAKGASVPLDSGDIGTGQHVDGVGRLAGGRGLGAAAEEPLGQAAEGEADTGLRARWLSPHPPGGPQPSPSPRVKAVWRL